MVNSLSKKDIICLVAIVALAGVIRFWNLGGLPLHGDEFLHFLSSSAIHEHGIPIMDSGLVYTRSMPLLYLQSFSTAIFGDNVFALRLPSAIIGTLTVFVTFIFFRNKIPSASVIISLLVAISPLAVFYSRNARMYELLLASSLALWAIAGGWKRTGLLRYLIGTLLLIIFVIPVHKLSLIIVLGIGIPSILNPRLSLRTRVHIAGLQLVSVASWFWYYKWFLKVMFPLPESLVFSKMNCLISPDCTLLLQVFSTSPILTMLILILGFLLVGAVVLRYRGVISPFERVIIWIIIGFAALHFSMISVCIAIIWTLFCIYREDDKNGRIIQIFLSGFGIAVFTLFWALLAIFYSDMSFLAAISRCFAYPKVFQTIVLPFIKADHLLDLLLLGYAIFLLLFCRRKFLKNIQVSSLAGISIFIIFSFAMIGITNTFYSHIRYLYIFYPLIIGLGIISLQQLKPRVISRVAILSLILFFLYGSHSTINVKAGEGLNYDSEQMADFDSVSRRLQDLRRPGDIVISTSSHKTAAFGGRQDGFFAVRLREYAKGHRHYITNALILRTPNDLLGLISESRGTIWMIVRLQSNLPDWTIKLFSSQNQFNEVFRSSDGEVVLYSATREEIINAFSD